MLNEKARAAVDLAEAAVAEEKLDNECGCTGDSCVNCREAMNLFEGSLAKYQAIAGEAGETREILPGKRYGYNQKSVCGGQTIYMRTGNYPDGRLAEIFIDVSRQGATLRGVFSAFGIVISLGLQHGVPLKEFVDAMVGTKFEPAGMVHGNELVPRAGSLIDLIFLDLALTYGVPLSAPPETVQDLSV